MCISLVLSVLNVKKCPHFAILSVFNVKNVQILLF